MSHDVAAVMMYLSFLIMLSHAPASAHLGRATPSMQTLHFQRQHKKGEFMQFVLLLLDRWVLVWNLHSSICIHQHTLAHILHLHSCINKS